MDVTRASFDQQITFLATSDLAATAHFYEQLLGLSLWLDQGDCRIYQVTAGGYLGFCQRPAAGAAGVILCLVTADVDGWAARLQAQGVPLEKPPQYHPAYHIYHCLLRDPNGYLVEIQRFEPGTQAAHLP